MSSISILAFDFGLKHIGVAVGQTQVYSASALCTIKATQGKPDWQHLEQLVVEWNPALLLVGLPLNMDGSASDMSGKAEKFSRRLHARINIPVELVDERLSSFEANQRGARADSNHAEAAQVIAQTWLNEMQNTKTSAET